jgi:cytoskeletal protein CcmA (bactofilin family)
MFKKNKTSIELGQQEITTLIGEGYQIEGKVSGNAIVRIDGKVNGDVTIEHGLILGEKGIIVGDIDTKSAIIYGKVVGNLNTIQVEIKRTGVVEGNIKTSMLEIELGAKYNGQLEMKQTDSK